jgi:hypothetical protein
MNELDSDVLRVCCVRPATAGQEAATPRESVGHFSAGECQVFGFLWKEAP